MKAYLDFEKPIIELESKLRDLQQISHSDQVNLEKETQALEQKIKDLLDQTYSNLSAWQKVQLSRHPQRPHAKDVLDSLFPDFMELHGDRQSGEDRALLGGIASWTPQGKDERHPLLILAQEKGRKTNEKVKHNFGMLLPEGYRKAIRLAQLAERQRIPILTIVDTPGAYPSIAAEERGQATAIGECLHTFFELTVPVCSLVLGEGGSGGALALAVGNRVLMMEHATYSVISAEGCASILWNDSRYAEKASQQLGMTAPYLKELKVIDRIIPEPRGAAQRDWEGTFQQINDALHDEIDPWMGSKPLSKNFLKSRKERFRKIGKEAFRK